MKNQKNEEQKKSEEVIYEPENVVSFTEEQIEEIRSEAQRKAKGYHKWVQKGNYIVCKSCDNRHAFEIGMKKLMVGVDEKGNPILKDKHEVFKKT